MSCPSSLGTVYVLDDEPEMVKALTRLLRAKRFDVRGSVSVGAFLKTYSPEENACLVLDVAVPELDGLELQRCLSQQEIPLPIIFLTGHGDIPMSVRAIKAGATDFFYEARGCRGAGRGGAGGPSSGGNPAPDLRGDRGVEGPTGQLTRAPGNRISSCTARTSCRKWVSVRSPISCALRSDLASEVVRARLATDPRFASFDF